MTVSKGRCLVSGGPFFVISGFLKRKKVDLSLSNIPEEVIRTIREQADIVEVVSQHLSLKKTGQNYTGLCPFHHEKTPSFVVSPVRQIFHCFGCGVGGNVY